jgi:hypothetical protein
MNLKPSRFSLVVLLVGCGGGATAGSAADAQPPLDGTMSSDGTMQEAGADGAVGAESGMDSGVPRSGIGAR